MTAVEWLVQKTELTDFWKEEIQQALEMEKQQIMQQIMDAWDRGLYIGQIFPQGNIENIYEQDSEQYYSETYKKENK
jgi:hypothetical protein